MQTYSGPLEGGFGKGKLVTEGGGGRGGGGLIAFAFDGGCGVLGSSDGDGDLPLLDPAGESGS